ncbi:acetolactate decarboxylase [Curtobacterium flaccumfaciens]|uniref:Alpha-acetolactate decarboxylase n=1 Tax=Curtobacterium flaccumfaciens TaxID=2035 RepID=A0A4R6DNN1_9MICO|nr:acetolactate decarboxylase [Curtobacterium flaccumfaciens]TDN46586.1 acetolactate decarboxylase [Curtobacterium flaccumfaciens]
MTTPSQPTHRVDDSDDYAVYQTSTISALLAGVYDGDVTVAQLLEHGDFGLGTFNHLDGEMVVVDGVCYHLRDDGSVTVASSTDRTPYAAVMRFHGATEITVDEPCTLAAVTARVDAAVGSPNLPVAVRIDGTFSTVRTRTVGEQHEPYPPLVEATAYETTNTLHETTGTVAGFRTPRFEQAISVAGYHLHYVDDARQHGGHVLDVAVREARVRITPISEMRLAVPDDAAFLGADIDVDQIGQQERQAEG